MNEDVKNALDFLFALVVAFAILALLVYGFCWCFDIMYKWKYVAGIIFFAALLRIVLPDVRAK